MANQPTIIEITQVGIQGFSGFSGYSGFSGISGFSGYSGISGFSGYSGISGVTVPNYISGISVTGSSYSTGSVIFSGIGGTQVVLNGTNTILFSGASSSSNQAGLYFGTGDPNGQQSGFQGSIFTTILGNLWSKTAPGTTNTGWDQFM